MPGLSMDPEKRAALFRAALEDDADAIRALGRGDSGVDCRSPEGETPLMIAAREGSYEALQALLELGADAGARSDKGLSAAHYALAGEEPDKGYDVIACLVKAGAQIDVPDAQGQTPLQHAIAAGVPLVAQCLVTLGGDPGRLDAAHALLFAGIQGDPERAARALAAGADTRACDARGWTALHFAAAGPDGAGSAPAARYVETVRVLLAAGADPASRSSGLFDDTPLVLAFDAEVVRLLVAAGADPNQFAGVRTPLMEQAWRDRSGPVRALIELGADLHLKQGTGTDALQWAVNFPNDSSELTASARLLIDAGAFDADTLAWAEREGHVALAEAMRARSRR